MLETSFLWVAIEQDGGIFLNSCTMPHVHFCVDLGSAATVNKVTTSGVLFHNCTMTHDQFPVVHVHNCSTPHNGFHLDLGSAATVNKVTTSGVLFHNCTMHYVGFRVDLGSAPSNIMTSQIKKD
jgi:hypothetical protein